MLYNVFLVFLYTILIFSGCRKQKKGIYKILIKDEKITVEVANTPLKRMKGLSFRESIPENHGILFVFPDAKRREFWMFKCRFDIDIAYIDEYGFIDEIITMKREDYNESIDSLKMYSSSSSNIKYALEMRGGWFEEHNIEPGYQINLKNFYAVY